MKKSFFRSKVFFLKLLYLLPYFVAIAVLQTALYAILKGTMLFYVVYPLVYIALEIGFKGHTIILVWYLNIFAFFVLGFLFLKDKLRIKRYLPCPYCDDPVEIFYQWGCPKCKQFQPGEDYITANCQLCDNYLNSFFCENCDKEFKL